MHQIHLAIVLAPLSASIIAGLFGRAIGRTLAHVITIAGVAVACALSIVVLHGLVFGGDSVSNYNLYTWALTDGLRMQVGFLIDSLSAMMMVVVTFVSLMVHLYTIGYMKDDPGYQRFFSYISLFTFAMLMLVMSNNFLQLFFGWEAVGLVSYLLIGFWYKKPTAIFANMKAFLVNRVGDFGFLLGIAAVVALTGTLDYAAVFEVRQSLVGETLSVWPGTQYDVLTVICVLLFIGAMGKSAQAPLHVWLPDSMEGPTPISALIHAATMVTAGIFMVARMSPLYELSVTALNVVVVIGAITAFFMGLLGIVQNDIKRVVAYSTLSQLGYMTVALGASAYAAGVFHLMTHAFFKALLFLAAGSVIIAMHHEQDIRKMGGLKRYLPITYWTSLFGSLALIGFPFTSGFFSKDALIEAVKEAEHLRHGWPLMIAYWSVLSGVFITALYSFRMFFVVFHGEPRMDTHTREHLHESPWVVTVPLVLLAIPSLLVGWFTIEPMLFGEYFNGAILVDTKTDPLALLGTHWHGQLAFVLHAFQAPALWLSFAGVATAWFIWLRRPDIAATAQHRLSAIHTLLINKYYADDLWIKGFAGSGVRLGRALWRFGDQKLIDGAMVNGTASLIAASSAVLRRMQGGYLYVYAFAMVIGLTLLLGWLLFRSAVS
ncbi:MAG: NADH-quinone oxidoreductase subunit L [Pseudomonadota bacterium]